MPINEETGVIEIHITGKRGVLKLWAECFRANLHEYTEEYVQEHDWPGGIDITIKPIRR
jgi:hypothetical protein